MTTTILSDIIEECLSEAFKLKIFYLELEWSFKSAQQAWQASAAEMIRWLGDLVSTQEYSSKDKVQLRQ